MGTVRKDDWKDEDGDANDDALLSNAFLSSALVPEVRFVIATIVIAIMVAMAWCTRHLLLSLTRGQAERES